MAEGVESPEMAGGEERLPHEPRPLAGGVPTVGQWREARGLPSARAALLAEGLAKREAQARLADWLAGDGAGGET